MKAKWTFLLSLITLSYVYGQDMKWPEDRAKAELKVAMYSDELEFGNYRKAADNLYWILVNAPQLHLSIYQNGAKIYENLANVETDPALKKIYLDSLMWMYDMRMKYYNDSVNVMNRKIYSAYRYFVRDKSKYEWLLAQFDEAIRISGVETFDNNLPAYMNVIKLNRLSFNNLTLDDVFNRYDKVNEILDGKAAKGEDVQKIKDFVDKLLTETIPEGIDCDFVKSNLGPKFYNDRSDLVLAKRIFAFMLNGKCTDDPLFIDVAKAIQEKEPTYGMAYKVIGMKCLSAKDFDCAMDYFNQALSLASNNQEKAEVYNDIARIYASQDKKENARDYYRKALAIDPNNKDSYEGIGNLYFFSASECAQRKDVVDIVKDRLPYIAAYNMYEKAGNQKLMQAAKEQFPSVEEVFTANLESGQAMTVGCWINETVVLKTRD